MVDECCLWVLEIAARDHELECFDLW